jgi:predicted nuclease of predicted toxin-antitoxin system
VKLLLDTCMWPGVVAVLRRAGHDVDWSGSWPGDPGDGAILAHAATEGRVLVTLDKDFGELAVLRGQRHHGILRLVNFAARQQPAICIRVLRDHGAELQAGAIITAEPWRVRIRAPGRPDGQ